MLKLGNSRGNGLSVVNPHFPDCTPSSEIEPIPVRKSNHPRFDYRTSSNSEAVEPYETQASLKKLLNKERNIEEEDIKDALEKYPSFQELPDYFPMIQNIFDKSDLKDIVKGLIKYECFEFVGNDIKAAYKKTVKNINTVDVPALFFAKVLSNQVKKAKISKIRQTELDEQRKKAASRDTSFYYNWLED